MRKLFFCLLLLILSPSPVLAQQNFSLDIDSLYGFTETGFCTNTSNFIVTNLVSTVYSPAIDFKYSGNIPVNIKGSDINGPLDISQNKLTPDSLEITVTFSAPSVGKDKTYEFTLESDCSPATSENHLWSFHLPQINTSLAAVSQNINISTPEIFGNPVNIDPYPDFISPGHVKYTDRSDIPSIRAIYGQSKSFDFSLTYILDKPFRNSTISLLLPSDNDSQQIYFHPISPPPNNIFSDNQNWIAVYKNISDSDFIATVSGIASVLSYLNPTSLILPSSSQSGVIYPTLSFSSVRDKPYLQAKLNPPDFDWSPPKYLIPFLNLNSTVSISNPQGRALYNIPIKFNGNNIILNTAEYYFISQIPPYSQTEIPVNLSIPLYYFFFPGSLTIDIHGHTIKYNIPVSLLLPFYVIFSLIFTAFFIWVVTRILKSGRISFQKLS